LILYSPNAAIRFDYISSPKGSKVNFSRPTQFPLPVPAGIPVQRADAYSLYHCFGLS